MRKVKLKEPYNRELLIEKLRTDFPDYSVAKPLFGDGIIVRKRLFTSRMVTIVPLKRNNLMAQLSNGVDTLAIAYLLLFWPAALYIFIFRRKQVYQLEKRVADVLQGHSEIENIGKKELEEA